MGVVKMNIDLKDYRQPMVTSLGVMLGFLIGFLGQWVTEDNFALAGIADYVVFGGSVIGVSCLLSALFRMLNPTVPAESHLAYYKSTLNLYMGGVVVAFVSMLVSAFI